MGNKTMSSEKWCQYFGISRLDIMDPDGWDRKNFKRSWGEAISQEEFVKRLKISTVHRTVGMSRALQSVDGE